MLVFYTRGKSTNAIAATTTAKNRTLPNGTGINCQFYNSGTTLAFIEFGNSMVGASSPIADGAHGSIPLPAGGMVSYSRDRSDTHWSAVMSSGTATIYCTIGDGL